MANLSENFDDLVQIAVLGADAVAIGFEGTGAEKTRTIVHRALHVLIYNDIINVKHRSEWPEWITLDPTE